MESWPDVVRLNFLQVAPIEEVLKSCQLDHRWLNFCLKSETASLMKNRRHEMADYYYNEIKESQWYPLALYKLLIHFGALTPNQILKDAIAGDQVYVAEYLLDHYMIDPDDYLRLAVEMNNPEMVRLFLERGADPNRISRGEPSLLYVAVANENEEMVKLLLDQDFRANPNLRNQDEPGQTPLLKAIQKGDPEIITLLLMHGADPNLSNSWGESPLAMAIVEDDLETVRELIEHGADPTLKDPFGNTPLSLAVEQGTQEIADYLAEHK